MVELGFWVFPESQETTLQNHTPEMKKDFASLQCLNNQSDKSGEYRNRTDDLLTASQNINIIITNILLTKIIEYQMITNVILCFIM